ncbi:Hypothetical predicted protein [Cloeon dipterum]|uniref:Tyrosine-protein kinase n=1 Tax=Cloeon dipterum TaxID=197152 RepID=A0A8S1BQ41_9INSE|nr:Hypothetical predicted protein [Cloeon dipterum]
MTISKSIATSTSQIHGVCGGARFVTSSFVSRGFEMGCCQSREAAEPDVTLSKPDSDAVQQGNFGNHYLQSPMLPGPPQFPAPPAPVVEESLEGKKVVVGVFDYKAREDGDLTFKKGDKMAILNDTNQDWWKVRHLATRKEGLIPSNYVAEERSIESEDWFFAKTTRREAEKYLMSTQTPRGTFLIRNSEHNPDGFSLSVRDHEEGKGDHVKHYKIRTSEDKTRYFVSVNHHFPNLQAFVQAYSKNSHGLCCMLTQPCPKPRPERWDLSPAHVDRWEIDRNELVLTKKLGSGNFGEVWLGKWKDESVAVKTLKPGSMSASAFLEEAAIMKKFRHKNLVALFAVCSKDEPMYIIQEFMKKGSLLDYLRHGDGRCLLTNDLIYISAQIASGMHYLENLNLIHRDIAARNILVTDNNLVKICDFGLARLIEDDEYCAKAGGRFPIKWTAPEAILYNRFTIKSDVWSYGILLMEIFTYGQVPYPGMTTKDVMEALERDYRMPKPHNVPMPDQVYETMLICWDGNPERRPTFEFLKHFFEDFSTSIELAYREPDMQ